MESTLRERYGFRAVALAGRPEGGYANDVSCVVADGARYALHVKAPPVDPDDVARRSAS